MRSIALAFLTGVFLCQQLPALPAVEWAWLLLPALLGLLCRLWLRLPSAALAGFLWAVLYAQLLLAGALPETLEGKNLEIIGRVASLPETVDRGVRFAFAVESLDSNGKQIDWPNKIRLSWYRSAPELRVGERWRLTVRLKQPHGFLNPGGMDFERWLFQQQIRATGYVRNKAMNERLGPAGFAYPVDQLRQALREQMQLLVSERPFFGLLLGLVIGDRSGVSQDQWEQLSATGTNHLMAISGLHIGLVAGLVYFMSGWLWRRWSRLLLLWPAPKAAALAAMFAAMGYAALAGFSIPTQRALIMIAVVMISLIMGRRMAPSQGLALALLLVLLWDPLAVTSAGFWLSFAAVAVIFYTMSGRLRATGWWWRWGRVQWVMALALFPLLLLQFQQASLVSPLANLLAVPWMSFVVIPLALLAAGLIWLSPQLAEWLLILADWALQGLWQLLAYLAELPFALWQQPVPLSWTLAPALIGVFWLLAPRGLPGRWLGLLWLAPMLVMQPARPPAGEAWLSLLDVGQGLATVVLTQNHSLVFDAGPRFSANFDTGEAVVIPFLRQMGIRRLDKLIISHGDNDHIGGAASLLSQYPVADIQSSVPEKLGQEPSRLCQAKERWQWDGILFELLNPDDAMLDRGGNDASCVLRVSNAGGALLLTGDIEKRAERRLLSSNAKLSADVLLAPHHGSRTSSTAAFIRAVNPDWVLFPVGYRNRFGFPKAEVVARYRAQGVQSLDTASSGMISVKLTATGVMPPEAYRRVQRRYWRHTFFMN